MAVDAGTITGKLDLDISGFQQGLSQAASSANSSLHKIEQSSESSSRSIGDKLKGMFTGWSGTLDEAKDKVVDTFGGISTAAKVGLGVAAAGIAGFAKVSVDAYSQYEQLSGGIQKLYGNMGMSVEEYARTNNKSVEEVTSAWQRNERAQKIVFDNAQQAYKTAGMSANDYMQQATTFSAKLIRDLGGNTEEAARVTDVAIRAMSDNYNTFGGNIQDIQNAFNGFAKENYSMLDNLKLGYGGTKSEMERLIADANEYAASIGKASNLSIDSFADVVEAIQLIQEKQQIAGTTAREASTTIEGSFNTMKAAWVNFVTEFGKNDGDVGARTQELVESVSTYLGNLIPRISQIARAAFEEIPKVLKSLKEQLPGSVQAIIDVIGTLGPAIVGIVAGITTVVEAIKIGKKIQEIAEGFQALWAVLAANPVLAVVAAIVAIVAALTTLYMTNEDFRNSVNELIDALGSTLAPVIDVIQSKLSELSSWFTSDILPILSQIGASIGSMVEVVVARLQDLWNFLSSRIFPILSRYLKPLFDGIVQSLQDLSNALGTIIEDALRVIKDVFVILESLFKGDWQGVLDGFKNLFVDAWTLITDTFKGAFTVIGDLASGWMTSISTVIKDGWNGIVSFFSAIWDSLSQFLQNVGNSIVEVFTEGIPNTINSVAEAIANWVAQLPEQAAQVGSQFVDAVIDFFTSLPEKIGYALGLVIAVIVLLPVELAKVALQVGSQFIDVVVNFFLELPSKIQQFLDEVVSNIVAWVSTLASNAEQAGSSFVDNVIRFLSELPGNMQQLLSNIMSEVAAWADNMRQNASQAGQDFLDNIINFFSQLPGRISDLVSQAVNGISNFPSQMASNASSAGQQFTQSISNGLNNAVSFVHSIPSRILNALSGLGYLLWNAGANVMNGFLRGLYSGWSNVQNFVGSIGSWIARHKGPEEYDKSLLVKNGTWIIQGLDKGLEESFKKTERKVSKYGERLQNAFGDFSSNVSSLKEVAVKAETPSISFKSQQDENNVKIDYDYLAQTLANVLREMPIMPQVSVEMKDGDVMMDGERVGRKVAPVVSRVQAKKVSVVG